MLNLEQEQGKERQFICACGKAYFSYAALFTHVKQKHDGKVNNVTFRRQDPSLNLSQKTKEVVLVRYKPKLKATVRPRALLQENPSLKFKICRNLTVGIKTKIQNNQNIFSSQRQVQLSNTTKLRNLVCQQFNNCLQCALFRLSCYKIYLEVYNSNF